MTTKSVPVMIEFRESEYDNSFCSEGCSFIDITGLTNKARCLLFDLDLVSYDREPEGTVFMRPWQCERIHG